MVGQLGGWGHRTSAIRKSLFSENLKTIKLTKSCLFFFFTDPYVTSNTKANIPKTVSDKVGQYSFCGGRPGPIHSFLGWPLLVR